VDFEYIDAGGRNKTGPAIHAVTKTRLLLPAKVWTVLVAVEGLRRR
jgi:hypothetical protein